MNSMSINQREKSLYLIVVLASVCLSFFLAYRETVINPDAICYLLSAEAVGKSGIFGAMQLCGQAKWPFYSVLIYQFVQLTHFSYAVAAYVLNGFFSLVSVIAFISIVKELGGSRRVLWLAAAVILLAHEFNSVRQYIIRDHGFWAFYLISLLFLIRFYSKPSLKKGLLWSASLIMATLFRIEGAIFLLTMPFLSFFYFRYTFWQRCRFFFLLNIPLILVALMIGGWLLLHPQDTLDKLGRVSEVTTQLQHGFSTLVQHYENTKIALAQHVLTTDSRKDAGLVLLLLLVAWYFVLILGNLSWIYALLIFYAIKQKAVTWQMPSMLVIAGYIIVNVAVTFIFLLEHLFLSKRYMLALSLVLMLFVPFALDQLLQNSWQRKYQRFLAISIVLILFSAMGGVFDFGYSKAYIHHAGDWLAKNVPHEAALYANDYQLMYYSKHFGDEIFKKQRQFAHIDTIAQGRFKQYDYIALRLGNEEELKVAPLLREFEVAPMKIFSNKRGDRVIIYQLSSRSNH